MMITNLFTKRISQRLTRPIADEGRGGDGITGGCRYPWRHLCCIGLVLLVLISIGSAGCSKGRQEAAKEGAGEKASGKSAQEEVSMDLLKLDKHAQELAGIKTVVIKREAIAKVVEFPAEIDFDQTRIFTICSPIDGKVVTVNSELWKCHPRQKHPKPNRHKQMRTKEQESP